MHSVGIIYEEVLKESHFSKTAFVMAAAKRLKSAVEKHCILLFHRVFIGILNYHVMKKRLLSISRRELSVVIIYE